MEFKEYQSEAAKTAKYPDRGNSLIYPTLGLVGEAGEVAEKVKRVLRDDGGVVSKERLEEIVLELGDVLWYVSAICDELNLELNEIAQINLNKLQDRAQRQVLRGSGDRR